MTKTQVHIVFHNTSEWSDTGNEFIGVFFNRAEAEEWIASTRKPSMYFIETYEQPEAGMAHEVYA
jgi:hypothetical protein